MVGAYFGAVTVSIATLAALQSAPAVSETMQPITVASLAGSWAGQAKLIPASGPAEFYKCIMTYAPNVDGSEVKQNLLCKSPQFTKFDAATQLSIAGEKVTGKWQDAVSSMAGTGARHDQGRRLRPRPRQQLLPGQDAGREHGLRAVREARPHRHDRHEGDGGHAAALLSERPCRVGRERAEGPSLVSRLIRPLRDDALNRARKNQPELLDLLRRGAETRKVRCGKRYAPQIFLQLIFELAFDEYAIVKYGRAVVDAFFLAHLRARGVAGVQVLRHDDRHVSQLAL